jgi:hypothetical protein
MRATHLRELPRHFLQPLRIDGRQRQRQTRAIVTHQESSKSVDKKRRKKIE